MIGHVIATGAKENDGVIIIIIVNEAISNLFSLWAAQSQGPVAIPGSTCHHLLLLLLFFFFFFFLFPMMNSFWLSFCPSTRSRSFRDDTRHAGHPIPTFAVGVGPRPCPAPAPAPSRSRSPPVA